MKTVRVAYSLVYFVFLAFPTKPSRAYINNQTNFALQLQLPNAPSPRETGPRKQLVHQPNQTVNRAASTQGAVHGEWTRLKHGNPINSVTTAASLFRLMPPSPEKRKFNPRDHCKIAVAKGC